ncbi:MAG: hypothetical protein AAF556_00705 [Pseudomonadota bacterium]
MSETGASFGIQSATPDPASLLTSRRFAVGRSINEALRLAFAGWGSLALVIVLIGVVLGLARTVIIPVGSFLDEEVIEFLTIVILSVVGWSLARVMVAIRHRQATGQDSRPFAALREHGMQPIRGLIAYLVSAITTIAVFLPTVLLAFGVAYSFGLSALGNPIAIFIAVFAVIANSVLAMSVILVGPLSAVEKRHFAIKRSAMLMKGKRLKALIGFIIFFIVILVMASGALLLVQFLSVLISPRIISPASTGLMAFAAVAINGYLIVVHQQLVDEKEGGDQTNLAEVFS